MSVDPIAVFAAFTTQVGARQLNFDFTDAQRRIFAMPATQKVILFAMFYFSTRNLKIALALWVFYHLAIWVLLNEDHPLNVLPRSWVARSEGFEGRVEKTGADLYAENIARMAPPGSSGPTGQIVPSAPMGPMGPMA